VSRGDRQPAIAPSRATTLRQGLRFFAAPADEPRARRATDILLLVPTLIGLGILIALQPPGPVERSLISFLASFPAELDTIWRFFYDLLGLWALVVVAASLVRRRPAVALQGVTALLLAALVAAAAGRIATGDWPSLHAGTGLAGSAVFPSVRVAEAAAIVITSQPHLARPVRVAGFWLVMLGAASAAILTITTPTGVVAALLAAAVGAALARLLFGTSAGRPGLDEVQATLAELGVRAERLQPAEREVVGVFLVRGRDEEGRQLLVKVYGRDAYDNQVLVKFWRGLWYRDPGPALSLSRAQAAEHEAFLTLLAAKHGLATREVVTAGSTITGDSLLVLRGGGIPLAATPADVVDSDLLHSGWRQLALLHAGNIAHRQIDPTNLIVEDGELKLIDLGGAVVGAPEHMLLTDRAQLLASTAAMAGPERATAAASDALGQDGVAALLPYLQSAAFSSELRRALRTAGLDADDLRAQTAATLGAEAPELVRLRRMTWGAALRSGLLILAVWAVVSALGGIDMADLRTALEGASVAWIVVGFIVAQTPRPFQAISTIGSIAVKLAFGPVYALQLAMSFLNLALPSQLARMAVNVRFFQRQGVPPATAITAGTIDAFAGNVIQIILLVLLLLFSEFSLSVDMSSAGASAIDAVALIAVLVIALVGAVLVIRPLRAGLRERVRTWWPEVKIGLRTLRAGHKLGQLLGGNFAAEILFAVTLGIFAYSLGYPLSLANLLVINLSVSLLASVIPVPGGIGVVEGGLMVGLTASGVPQEAALAIALLHRIATFYLPPTWGWFAMRWLEKNSYL
jgi:uncharacterized membrane protein YbhN (UPF0104 family)/tRNA A-37 threonylcarbamoyl transferase component Bud32